MATMGQALKENREEIATMKQALKEDCETTAAKVQALKENREAIAAKEQVLKENREEIPAMVHHRSKRTIKAPEIKTRCLLNPIATSRSLYGVSSAITGQALKENRDEIATMQQALKENRKTIAAKVQVLKENGGKLQRWNRLWTCNNHRPALQILLRKAIAVEICTHQHSRAKTY